MDYTAQRYSDPLKLEISQIWSLKTKKRIKSLNVPTDKKIYQPLILVGSKQISLAARPLKSWLMSINYNPKVGEILECDFGNFVSPPLDPIYNGLISPEIRKRRMVVVINGKLPNSCCLVVPISSNFNLSAVERGFHIYLKPAIFDGTGFDDGFRNRWALSECITHVSKKRLFRMFNNQALVEKKLERELVSEIHRSIIKTVNAQSLLP